MSTNRLLQKSMWFLFKNYFMTTTITGILGALLGGSAMVWVASLPVAVPLTILNLILALIIYKTKLSRRFIGDTSYIFFFSLLTSLSAAVWFVIMIKRPDTDMIISSAIAIISTWVITILLLYLIKKRTDWEENDPDTMFDDILSDD